MSQSFEFFDERARAAESAAETAVLANVRERELRSAQAWREMADRALQVEAERVRADSHRAERRAAELALAASRNA